MKCSHYRRSILLSGTLLLALLVLTYCEEAIPVPVDLPQSRIVVASSFTLGKDVKIFVSKSNNLLSSEASEPMLDADVRIYDQDSLLEVLTYISSDMGNAACYQTKYLRPVVEKEYTIRITAPGFTPITATSSIPVQSNIRLLELEKVMITNLDDSNQQRYHLQVRLDYDDNPDQRNFYHLNFYQQVQEFRLDGKDTVVIREMIYPAQFKQIENNNFVLAAPIGGILVEDKPSADGLRVQLIRDINPRSEQLGNLFVELRSVSAEYYRFYSSVSRQQSGGHGNTFNEPVFIADNIINGHGFFGGYNAANDSLQVGKVH